MKFDEFSDKDDSPIEELSEDLRKWFKEKWVRFNPQGKIMGPCARGGEGEGKPKCLPQKKAQSLGKKGRASAASRKRRQDPNPERSGKAINVATKKKSNESLIAKTNRKIKNLLENKFPQLPDSKVFFDREKNSIEWIQFKKNLIEYQLKYNNGTDNAKLKMRKIPKFISESYHKGDTNGLQMVKNILKKAFQYSVEPQDLEIGKKYDVAVIYLDKLSKILEINAHHNQIIKNVKFSKSENEYIVSTEQGLEGTSVIDHAEEIETLFFENTGKLDSLLTFLDLKVSPEIDGWKLSIVSDNDLEVKKNTSEGLTEESLERFEVTYYSPKLDRNVTKLMKAENESDVWNKLQDKGYQVVSVEKQELSEEQLDEKKDACYHKVKSRYKVWPSAYASGALVKCRKVGAKNWGNKS
jgi:hypothetical protein